jgi:hypothetical protein
MGQTTSHPQGADLDVCAYRANITSNRLYFNFGGEADRPQLGVQPFGDLLPDLARQPGGFRPRPAQRYSSCRR